MWTPSSSHNPNLPPSEKVWDHEIILLSDLRHTSDGPILQELLVFTKAENLPPPQDRFCSLQPRLSQCDEVGKRRLPESELFSGNGRHKRMMKNRVSAARSRARKQAYTNELESQVAFLREENANLKKQQQQQQQQLDQVVCISGGDKYEVKKINVYRASSAPF